MAGDTTTDPSAATILTRDDAARLRALYPTLPPERQQWAIGKLQEYQKSVGSGVVSMTPVQSATYLKNEGQALGLLTDYDKTVMESDAPDSDKYKEWFKGQPEQVKQAERVSRANRFFVEHITGQSLAGPLGNKWARIRADLAAKLFEGVGAGSDQEFHSQAAKWMTEKKAEDEAVKELDDAVITNAALGEKPWADALSKWKGDGTKAGFRKKNEAMYEARASKVWEEMAPRFAAVRDLASDLLSFSEAETGAQKSTTGREVSDFSPQTPESLTARIQALPKDQRELLWFTAQKMAEAKGYAGKGYWKQLGESIGRGVLHAQEIPEFHTQQALEWAISDFSDKKQELLVDPDWTPDGLLTQYKKGVRRSEREFMEIFGRKMVPMTDAQREAATKTAQQQLAAIEIQKQIRDFSTGAVDPVVPHSKNFHFLETASYNIGGMVPLIVGASVPTLGPAYLINTFQAANYQVLKAENPDIPNQTLRQEAGLAAVGQGLVFHLISSRLLLNGLPKTAAVLSAPLLTGRAVAGRIAAKTGTEALIGGTAMLAANRMPDLVHALNDDVPGIPWSEMWEKTKTEAPHAFGDMALLALFGAGVGSLVNYRYSRKLASNPDALMAAGVPEATANTISDLVVDGQMKEAQTALREAIEAVREKGSGVTDEQLAAAKRLDEHNKTESEVDEQAMRDAGIEVKVTDNNGVPEFTVTQTKEGKAESHRFSDPEQAQAAADEMIQRTELERAAEAQKPEAERETTPEEVEIQPPVYEKEETAAEEIGPEEVLTPVPETKDPLSGATTERVDSPVSREPSEGIAPDVGRSLPENAALPGKVKAPLEIGKSSEADGELASVRDELHGLTSEYLPKLGRIFDGIEIVEELPNRKTGGFFYRPSTNKLGVALRDIQKALGEVRDKTKWAARGIIEEAIHSVVRGMEREGKIKPGELFGAVKADAPVVYEKFRKTYETENEAEAASEFVRMLAQGNIKFDIGRGIIINGELTEMSFTPRMKRAFRKVLDQVLKVIRDLRGKLPESLAERLEEAQKNIEDRMRELIAGETTKPASIATSAEPAPPVQKKGTKKAKSAPKRDPAEILAAIRENERQIEETRGKRLQKKAKEDFIAIKEKKTAELIEELGGEEAYKQAAAVKEWTSATEESDTGVFIAENPDAPLEVLGTKIPKLKPEISKVEDIDRVTTSYQTKMQKAVQEAERAAREINKTVRSKARQAYMAVWIEAGGDAGKLKAWEAGAKQRWMKEYSKGAQSLTPDEVAMAKRVSDALEVLGKRGQAFGVLENMRDNYIPHVWELMDRASLSFGRRLLERFKFAQARTFETFFDGDQAGYTPKTAAVGDLLPAYIREINKVIADRQLKLELMKGYAKDGRPLAVPRGLVREEAEAGDRSYFVLPRGMAKAKDRKGDVVETFDYTVLQGQPALSAWRWKGKDAEGTPIFMKSDLALHPDAARRVNSLTERSAIRRWADPLPGRGIGANLPRALARGFMKTQSVLKREMFSVLGLFHSVQEGTHAIGHKINPFKTPEIDLRSKSAEDAAKHGVMLRTIEGSANDYVEGVGSRSSFISQALRKFGGDGGKKAADFLDGYQHWLFERYIPGLKLKTYEAMVERNSKRYAKEIAAGTVTLEQIKFLSASQANAAYGHLNYGLLDRSPTVQHLFQMAALAPDFLEARGRFAGQAVKGIFSKVGREQIEAIGFLAAVQATAMFTLAQVTGGEWDWKHPFEFTRKNRRYTMRSVPEDLMAMFGDYKKFFGARINPLVSSGIDFAQNTNYRREEVTNMEVLRDLAAKFIPMTLRSMPGVNQLTETSRHAPTSPMEQFWGTVGIKISRNSPIREVHEMAAQWMEKQNIPKDKGVYPVSKYQQLRYALEDSDMEKAADEYRKLVKDSTPRKVTEGLRESILKTFTDSKVHEREFVASLDKEDREMYDLALQTKENILLRFVEMRKALGD